jgi:glycosyltransferase involved in cell wall biosynthesis
MATQFLKSGDDGASASMSSAVTEPDLNELPPEERGPAGTFLAAHPAGTGAPIAVVIPAYNEEPTVASVIREIPATLAGLPTEVIVVVDGSADATATEAVSAGALVCDIPVNRGQGVVFKLGYWLARARGAQVIATIDADGQYEPLELERVVEPIVSGRADFVNGSRRLGTELTTDPIRHACGIRGMRAKVSESVTLQQSQYQSSELLIGTAMRGFRVIEVATTMRDRPDGATGTKKGPNLLYGMRFARAVLGTWRRERNAARTRLRSEKTQ